jgi:hypothetical protein
MAKKRILFPLEMNGTKVHTLEELKKNFNVENVVEYAREGRLAKWLRDRGHNDVADALERLDKEQEDYANNIGRAVFGAQMDVTVQRQINIYLEHELQRKNEEKEEKYFIEQLKKEPPTVLFNTNGIYYVHDWRLICCKSIPSTELGVDPEFEPKHGLVQEETRLYYLKNVTKKDFLTDYYIGEINLDTGSEQLICKIDNHIRILGIRHHTLYYIKGLDRLRTRKDAGNWVICELSLDTLEQKQHKIPVVDDDYNGVEAEIFKLGYENICSSIYVGHSMTYPCVDADGRHVYCLIGDGSYDDWGYVADIDLNQDTFLKLTEPIKSRFYSNAELFTTQFGFLFWTESDAVQQGKYPINSVINWYNLITHKMQRLTGLEDVVNESWEFKYKLMCCGEGKVCWLEENESDEHINYFLYEYDMKSGVITERAHLRKSDFYRTNEDPVEEIFISRHYLYIVGRTEDYYGRHDEPPFNSWRFPLETWDSEKLIRNGNDFLYVPVAINT